MEIKTVSVHYERKFNLGDYNSATVGVNLWADLDAEEDNVDECLLALWAMAKENVKSQSLPLVKADKANVTTPVVTPPQPIDDPFPAEDPAWNPSATETPPTAKVPVLGRDWGLVEYKPKASDLKFGDRYEVKVDDYKATPAEIKFYRTGKQYPEYTHNMLNSYSLDKFKALFNNWQPEEDDTQHPIPRGSVILAIQCTDASKQTKQGNPYQNLDGMRRP